MKPPALINLDEASSGQLLQIGIASLNYKWHWMEAGYDPWHVDKPHVKQQKFHLMKSKFRGFIGGLGSGKTMAGAAEAVKMMISQPGSVGIITAPTYSMLDSSTKPMFLQLLQWDAIHKLNESKNYVITTNGSMAYFRSTDEPNRYRGINASWFWSDEGAYSTGLSWDILVGRLRQRNKLLKGWVTGTPKGMNWMWERFDSPNHPEEYAYVNATSRDNPWNPPEYVKTLQSTYSGIFAKQEIEGAFVAYEGLVYPNFNREIHVRDLLSEWKQGKLVFNKVLYFHDWGYVNPAVILVCGLDGDNRMYIMKEWYEKGKTLARIVDARAKLQEDFGKGLGIADPSEPGSIEEMNMNHLPTRGGNNEIEEGIKRAANRWDVPGDGRPRCVVDQRCVNFLMEVMNYRFPEKKEEKEEKEKPIKIHDHAMDAWRYGVMYLEKPRGSRLMRGSPLDEVI